MRTFNIIELKMGQSLKEHPKISKFTNLMVIGLNERRYTFKIQSLVWIGGQFLEDAVPPIHSKCTMALGLNQ